MGGRPVWLASCSRRSASGGIVSALKLPPRLLRKAQQVLHQVLSGVGDPGRERCFQMCITTCLHRALTDDEIEGLPENWKTTPALDIAGGPVRVVYSKGIAPTPSVEPCENYEREPVPSLGLDADNDPLWLAVECGVCLPCLARAAAVEAQFRRDQPT